MRMLPIATRPAPIPKVLHLVWVGMPPPPWARRRWDAWMRLHPTWTIHTWTDDTADAWPAAAHYAPLCPHPAILADLIRLEVVCEHGGVYVDTDTWPLRPIDPLAGDRPAWVCTEQEGTVNNAAFGCWPGHPVLSYVWEHATERLVSGRHTIRKGSRRMLHHIAGPPAWVEAVAALPGTLEQLPAAAFTPIGYDGRYSQIAKATRNLAQCRHRFPDTYAVHEYAQSWNKVIPSIRTEQLA